MGFRKQNGTKNSVQLLRVEDRSKRNEKNFAAEVKSEKKVL
jgi:hypothetical protein